MRDDGDFAAYLVARWTQVVRLLVLLGCPEPGAEDVARSAFARLSTSWGSVRDDADVDGRAYGVVLDEWQQARGRPAASPSDRPAAQSFVELEATLDGLTPDVRATLLLWHVADLTDAQVADAMDRPLDEVRATLAEHRLLTEEAFREASESIDVLPPSLPDVRRRSQEQHHRRRSSIGTSAAALAVVVGAATWWSLRPADRDDEALTIAPTARAENPADVVWFANGELHLDHVVIELPPMSDLVAISGGAVYVAEDGAVVFVADDGARTRLGSKEAGTPLVGSDEEGWVAWTEPGERAPSLVLYDLTSRQRLSTVGPVDGAPSSIPELIPVAIDQAQLYYRWGTGSFTVTPDGVPEQLDSGLLDVSSATRVFQSDPESIRMEQSFFSTVQSGLGVGAELSLDGDYVITRTEDAASSYGTLRIYDTRSGDELTTGLTVADVAIAATFGPDETVTYIVARAEDRPSADGFVRRSFAGALELRTCSLEVPSCAVIAKFPSTGSTPLLAD